MTITKFVYLVILKKHMYTKFGFIIFQNKRKKKSNEHLLKSGCLFESKCHTNFKHITKYKKLPF